MIRFVIRSLLFLGVGCVILALGALLSLYAGADSWLVNRLARNAVPGATTRVGSVGGNYFTGIELRDISLSLTTGEPLLRIDTVRARYSLPTLLAGNLAFRRIQLIAPEVTLKQSLAGSWNPFPRRSQPSSPKKSSGSPITVEHFSIVRGRGALRHGTGQELPIRLLQAEGSLGKQILALASLQLTTDSSEVSAHGSVPLPESGGRLNVGHLDLSVDAHDLLLRDLRGFRSEFDRDGSLRLNATARGDGPEAAVTAHASFSDGGSLSLGGVLTPPKQSPVHYRLDAVLRNLNPALLLKKWPDAERMNGKLAMDMQGENSGRLQGHARVQLSDRTRWATGSAALSAGRADVEVSSDLGPAAAKVQGWIRPFDSTPTYDLQARVRQGRRSTPPAWLVRLLGDSARSVFLRLEGRGLKPETAAALALIRLESGSADGLLDSASLRVRVRNGSASFHAGVGTAGGLIAMNGKAGWGSVRRLRVEHGSVQRFQMSALLGDTSWSTLDGEFSLGLEARLGGLRITSASNFNGAAIELDASRSSGRKPITTLKRLEVRHLDLSRFRSADGTQTDLTGTAQLSLGGGKLEQATGSGRLDLESSRIGQQKLTRARLEARLGKGRVDASGEMQAETGTFEFTASSRPFDSLPSYTVHHAGFQNLDLGRLLRNEEISTQLAGSLTAEGSGHGADDARLTATLLIDSSTVNRTFIRQGRLTASVIEGRLDVLGQVKGDGDSLNVDASVSQLRDHPRIRLTSQAGIRDLAALLGPRYPPDVAGAVALRLAGELDRPERMNLRGELRVTGRAGEFALDSSRVRLRLASGTATVDSFTMHSNVGSAGGAGKMHLFGDTPARVVQLRLGARVGDLAPVAPLLGAPDLTLDSAQIDATVSGTRDTMQVVAALHAAGLAAGNRRIGKLAASGNVELTGFQLNTGKGELLAQSIHTGRSPVQSVQLQGSSLSAGEYQLRGETVVKPGREGRFAVSLYPGKPETRLRLETLEARTRVAQWALDHPMDIRYGERILVDDFVLTSGRRRIAVNGTLDPKGQQQFSIRLDSLGIGAFTDLSGSEELDGVVNGALHLTGPAAAPRALADLSISLRSRNQNVASARSHLDWTNQGADLTALIQHPKNNDSLTIKGRIPVALSLADSLGRVRPIPGGPLLLDISSRRFDIGTLQTLVEPGTAKDLRGRLSIDAHARGTLDRPDLSGDVNLTEGKVRIPRLGATYQSGTVRVHLQGQEARLTLARLESGGGRLEATGLVRVNELSNVAVDIASKLKSFRVADAEDFRSSLSGDVKLGGTFGSPVLTGSLELHNTDFYLGAKNLEQSAEAVELTAEDLQILESRFGAEVMRQSKRDQNLLPTWGLDVNVALASNNWLRRRSDPVIAVELGGKLTVKKKPHEELQLFGQIQPRVGRSFVQLLGRRFDLKEGAVDLNGPLKDARIALGAEYRTEATGSSTPVVITADVKSDTGKLVVALGSIPPMRQADVVSYLTTGQAASTDPTLESEEQGVLNTGASLAFGAALGSVAGVAGQRVGLDVVQVLQDHEGAQTLVGGKYVSPALYLGFRQPIVPATTSSRSETQQDPIEFEVEYAALRKLLLNVQGGSNELRVFLRLRQ